MFKSKENAAMNGQKLEKIERFTLLKVRIVSNRRKLEKKVDYLSVQG